MFCNLSSALSSAFAFNQILINLTSWLWLSTKATENLIDWNYTELPWTWVCTPKSELHYTNLYGWVRYTNLSCLCVSHADDFHSNGTFRTLLFHVCEWNFVSLYILQNKDQEKYTFWFAFSIKTWPWAGNVCSQLVSVPLLIWGQFGSSRLRSGHVDALFTFLSEVHFIL